MSEDFFQINPKSYAKTRLSGSLCDNRVSFYFSLLFQCTMVREVGGGGGDFGWVKGLTMLN